MLRQKNKTPYFLALFLLMFSNAASAKRITFENRSAFGIGFRGGMAEAPAQTFTATPQTLSADYSTFYGIEPFLDFGNFSLRGSFNLHSHPLVSGSGRDIVADQNFSETSDASNFSYGLKLLLIPFRTKGDRARFYFGFGAGLANLYASNTRNYLDSTGTSTATHTEKARGSSQYLEGLLGFEFFLVQNYSLAIETGYKSLKFDQPEYGNETNVRGETVGKGTVITEPNGTEKSFSYSGFNGSLNFNLHF